MILYLSQSRFRSSWSLFLMLLCVQANASSANIGNAVTYTNVTLKGPISVNIVAISRTDRGSEIESIHSAGKAIGLAPVSEQVHLVLAGTVVAAVNGDFYVREGPFAGDPRGLQIVNGELISAPTGSASFWIDADNDPHIETTKSEFQVIWPDGTKSPFGLNGKCEPNQLQIYTSALGSLPAGDIGREIVLAPATGQKSAALRAGREYAMKVVAVRAATNAPIAPETLVLLLGRSAAKTAPTVQPGAQVKVSTATAPTLRGVKSAISGGPALVIAGKAQRFDKVESESFQYSSMVEKHPRSALGWNKDSYFWVEVDGRQKESVGMTLNELAAFMVELGCEEAMNLDGGGSSTLWFEGSVRNHPCDGYERPVANSLALVRKAAAPRK
jgi:hypothetical protein